MILIKRPMQTLVNQWEDSTIPPNHIQCREYAYYPADSYLCQTDFKTGALTSGTKRGHKKASGVNVCHLDHGHRNFLVHDDVIKWKHFPRYWPLVWGIHRPPVNSPHKGQWRGALMFSLICAWIKGWVNNGEAGDLRRYRAHYDVTVMYPRYLNLFDYRGLVRHTRITSCKMSAFIHINRYFARMKVLMVIKDCLKILYQNIRWISVPEWMVEINVVLYVPDCQHW